MSKDRFLKHLYDPEEGNYLVGPLSSLIPSTKILQLIYSDAFILEAGIVNAASNIVENAITGEIDITVKLSLKRKDDL